jgi:hypothetical protein
MCQIHIIKREDFELSTKAYTSHLESGARINDHGSAALFIDEKGNHSLLRAMKFEDIINMMHISNNWDQVIIHQRYTTQGAANLTNTHLWQSGKFLYCHNGVLQDEACSEFEVDSQLIGWYLEGGNVWDAIAYCQSEEYANVFIIDLEEKKLYVTRSKTNTLFTDGEGQFSTRKLNNEIDILVPSNTVEIINLDVQSFDKWRFDDYYSSYQPTKTYQEKVAAATHGKIEEIPADKADETELDDVVAIEQSLHDAIANEDKVKERRYNYLLEKANGNG